MPCQEAHGPTAETIEVEYCNSRVSCQGTNKQVRNLPGIPLDPTGIPHHTLAPPHPHCVGQAIVLLFKPTSSEVPAVGIPEERG